MKFAWFYISQVWAMESDYNVFEVYTTASVVFFVRFRFCGKIITEEEKLGKHF